LDAPLTREVAVRYEALEALEPRRLFAISYGLDAAGTLTVQGDGADDAITIAPQADGSYLSVDYAPANVILDATLDTGDRAFAAWPPGRLPPWQPNWVPVIRRHHVRPASASQRLTAQPQLPSPSHQTFICLR
jgi:hypothetical protein